MAVGKSLKTQVMDAKVVRGMFEGSDHYALHMKVKMGDKWKFRKRMNGERKRLRVERFRDKGIKEEYKRRVTEVLNGERENGNGNANVEDFETFINVLLGVKEEVVGMKVVKLGKREGMYGGQKKLRNR